MAGIPNSASDSERDANSKKSSNENLKDKVEDFDQNGFASGDEGVGSMSPPSEPETREENKFPVSEPGSPSEKKDEESETKEIIRKLDEGEVYLVHDIGFMVQMALPNGESFDLQVSHQELVQEIHQVLMDREDTCHRTCFSLQFNGNVMDNFSELKTIEGLKEGSVVKVVEEPYTAREARIHVRHVRDLLKSMDLTDAYGGQDCSSLSFVSQITDGDLLEKKKSIKIETLDCTPPEYILPGSKDKSSFPLMPLHAGYKDLRGPKCLKVLTYSGWNPPPGPRKMHGDLLYVQVMTLEDKKFQITATPRGFYVNQSTEDEFNPKPATPKHLCHSLVELLNNLSSGFKKNFNELLKKRGSKHPYERVPTPLQTYSWMAPQQEYTVDFIRAEDAYSTRLGYEEHIPGQTRDWNEELQTTRELPKTSMPERLIRERAMYKVHSDFVGAATRGAMAVIDGNVMAINPGESAKMQMFIWNNIFFSLGFDVRDHYKDFGGDAAAYYAPSNDLQGVKAFVLNDIDGLYTLGTVVVDYKGYRVTAQSIIPGILEREQEQSVVYGSIDFGKTIVTDEKYVEKLKKSCKILKIRPHKVVDDKENVVELYSSMECKGIIGNDKRYYVLDLLRTFPPDMNFINSVEREDFSPEIVNLGFPKKHPHRLACLRQELIDQFYNTRFILFVRYSAYFVQQMILKKRGNSSGKDEEEPCKDIKKPHMPALATEEVTEESLKETEDDTEDYEGAKQLVHVVTGIDFNDKGPESVDDEETSDCFHRAATEVGSLGERHFNIAFNPDLYQSHVKHADLESATIKKEKRLLREASEFILIRQIPLLLHECRGDEQNPIDSISLAEAMHAKGINIRYLGRIAECASKDQRISYLHKLAVSDIINRSAKHLFKPYVQSVAQVSLSSAISHFLNCFLGSFPSPHAQISPEETFSKKNKKKGSKKNKEPAVLCEWVNETPKSLWKKIKEEANDYFHFDIECESIDNVLNKFGLQRVSMLRSICKAVGIQILLRDYNFDVKNKQIFYEDDIVNIHPVPKHVEPSASDAYALLTSGEAKLRSGQIKEANDIFNEALTLFNNVYGAMHPEILRCNHNLGLIAYFVEDLSEAISNQQKAVIMIERVLGIDHPAAIGEYLQLALYCFANNQIPSALRLMYRARYIAILCFGEEHPKVALIDTNIGLVLHALQEFDLAIRYLQNAVRLNTIFFGKDHLNLKVAMGYHLLSRTNACQGDYRTALQNERESYALFKQILGENSDRVKESSRWLNMITTQAVEFQRMMTEISRGEKTKLEPLAIQIPSLLSVLDTLNLINGIYVYKVDQEKLRAARQDINPAKSKTIMEEDVDDVKPEIKSSSTKKSESVEEEKENTPLVNGVDSHIPNGKSSLSNDSPKEISVVNG